MRVTVKAGADKDGKLAALQLDVLSNTGAYGNHAGPVLFHSVGECIASIIARTRRSMPSPPIIRSLRRVPRLGRRKLIAEAEATRIG